MTAADFEDDGDGLRVKFCEDGGEGGLAGGFAGANGRRGGVRGLEGGGHGIGTFTAKQRRTPRFLAKIFLCVLGGKKLHLSNEENASVNQFAD
jgi:hypothetical protein